MGFFFSLGQVGLNWICLPRMYDLANAEFGKSMISESRCRVYYLLIRLIDGFIENHLWQECKAIRAYGLTMFFCLSD
jgi:hypothetical protein